MKDKTKITKFEELILIIEIILLVVIIISLCVSVNYLEKVNSIIGVLAMFVSIVTIVYTEEARKKAKCI